MPVSAAGEDEADEPVNILVVDDRRENRVALQAILADPGYRVVEAASGPEALRELLARDFAVLLFDVVMPTMSGFELASIARQRAQTASTPILFLTAEATDVEFLYKGYQVGAVDYLIKPLVPAMVRSKVGVFAQLYRQQRRVERQSAQLIEAARREGELRLLEQRLAGERRYRHLADSIPHIIFSARPDGTIDYVNERWAAYTGQAAAGAATWASALQSILHPADLAGAVATGEAALAGGKPFDLECRLLHARDGTYRWHLGRMLPDRDAEGRIEAWLGTFTDIEEQKRAQAVLAEFKGTLDAVQDAVLVFDASSWRVLHASHGASHMLGYGRGELLGMAPARLMPDFDEGALGQLVRRDGPPGQSRLPVETRYRHRDGHDIPVEASFQYIDIDSGRVVAIGRDISERKQAEAERRRLYEQAVEAVGIRDEFLSIASHELRTPLASLSLSIDSLVRLLREDRAVQPGADRTEKRLKRAARQVERLTHLVNDLLDVARINGGRLDLHPESLDLATLAREVIGRFSEDAERAGCAVTVLAGGPIVGRWDAPRMEQVLVNLLSNAMKFGSGKPIEVSIGAMGGAAIMVVRDHGIGITPEFRARMFGRFQRGVSGRNFGGLGLGLYIAEKIVAAHGGSIEASSEPGAGAVFTVRIPLDPTNGDAGKTVAPALSPGQAAMSA
jgi:PAS domain S-box-containing protein